MAKVALPLDGYQLEPPLGPRKARLVSQSAGVSREIG